MKIKKIINESKDRFQLWSKFVDFYSIEQIAEIGVYKGDFSKHLLEFSRSIKKYYLIDPWRNIEDWNKPANTNDISFENFYHETLSKTNFASHKRVILRGKTTEKIDEIDDLNLDFVYIDGDHTLKGIAIDLITSWSKIKENGFIAGDDFCRTIWQHNIKFEPTLIFPFALYFAEAMNVKIYALPFNQFLISKNQSGFEFINLTNKKYNKTNLLNYFYSKTEFKTQQEKSLISKLFGFLR